MYVINVLGYPFSFSFQGTKYVIPADNKAYLVPNNIPRFEELQPVLLKSSPQINSIPDNDNHIMEIYI